MAAGGRRGMVGDGLLGVVLSVGLESSASGYR